MGGHHRVSLVKLGGHDNLAKKLSIVDKNDEVMQKNAELIPKNAELIGPDARFKVIS